MKQVEFSRQGQALLLKLHAWSVCAVMKPTETDSVLHTIRFVCDHLPTFSGKRSVTKYNPVVQSRMPSLALRSALQFLSLANAM